MPISVIRRGLAAMALAAVVAAPAAADIKAFNAAVRAGDYKTAAVEAKAIWPDFNKTSPDAAVVAREFGFASYVAGDYTAARDYGLFLMDRGAGSSGSDDQPATSAVLLAASEYRLATNAGTRQSLFEALTKRAGVPGLDNVSVLASEALYRGDWKDEKWTQARASSDLAFRLLKRGGDQLAPRAMEAAASFAAAGFLEGRNRSDYEALVDVHDEIIDAIDAAVDSKKRNALVPLKYQTQAWTMAVGAYFTANAQVGSNISKNVKWRTLKKPKSPLFEPEGLVAGEAPLCKGEWDLGEIQYPRSTTFRGLSAAVVAKMETDAAGVPTKREILGAAPSSEFANLLNGAAPDLRLRLAKDDPAGCRLAQRNLILAIAFQIG